MDLFFILKYVICLCWFDSESFVEKTQSATVGVQITICNSTLQRLVCILCLTTIKLPFLIVYTRKNARPRDRITW